MVVGIVDEKLVCETAGPFVCGQSELLSPSSLQRIFRAHSSCKMFTFQFEPTEITMDLLVRGTAFQSSCTRVVDRELTYCLCSLTTTLSLLYTKCILHSLLLPRGLDTISLLPAYTCCLCFSLLDQAGKAFRTKMGSRCFSKMDPAL